MNGVFDSIMVAKNYAHLWAEDMGKFWIKQVSSTYGKFLDGQRLLLGEEYQIRGTDTL